MSKQRRHKSFYQGKGIRGDDHTSFEGEPNTNLDVYRKDDGRFIQRRKFGEDGFAVKDYDIQDEHKSYDHVHDINRDGRESNDRLPNKKEKREIDKAKRKRRFWNDRF